MQSQKKLKNMTKLVSIIIPCYNQEKYISDAIMSAENQTYKDIEIVFIDDCSTDGSLEVANELKKKYTNIVVLKNETNLGVVDSRNKAIDVAKGFYILPLDGDDTIEPTYIEKAVKVFDENPDVGFVYCKARKFGAVNEDWNLPKFNKESFIFGNCIVNSSLFRKSDFIKLGKYKSYMYSWTEDYDLWMSFVEAGLLPYRIDKILYNHREFDNGSRTQLTTKDPYFARREYLLHHTKLYADSRECISRIFDPDYKSNFYKKDRKIKKYKMICILEAIATVLLAICLIGTLIFS